MPVVQCWNLNTGTTTWVNKNCVCKISLFTSKNSTCVNVVSQTLKLQCCKKLNVFRFKRPNRGQSFSCPKSCLTRPWNDQQPPLWSQAKVSQSKRATKKFKLNIFISVILFLLSSYWYYKTTQCPYYNWPFCPSLIFSPWKHINIKTVHNITFIISPINY